MKTLIGSLLIAGSMFGAVAQADSKSPVVLIAIVKVKAGNEQAFRQAAAKNSWAPTRAEPGNISYEFTQAVQDPTSFATEELWVSQKDADQHLTLPHMQQFFQVVGSMFEPGYPVITSYQKFEN